MVNCAIVGASSMLRALLWSWFLLSLHLPTVHAGARNITIDDTNGDEVTGALPHYSSGWSPGASCSSCWAKPDPSKAVDGTWHDTSAYTTGGPTSATLSFTGPCATQPRINRHGSSLLTRHCRLCVHHVDERSQWRPTYAHQHWVVLGRKHGLSLLHARVGHYRGYCVQHTRFFSDRARKRASHTHFDFHRTWGRPPSYHAV